jgi:hypothetical protein
VWTSWEGVEWRGDSEAGQQRSSSQQNARRNLIHNASTTILLNTLHFHKPSAHITNPPPPPHTNMQTAADVTVLVSSDNSFSERRINPSWTISALKAKLYPITGIPVGSQQLTLRLPQAPAPINIVAVDEDATQLSQFLLQHSIGAEIHVCTFCLLYYLAPCFAPKLRRPGQIPRGLRVSNTRLSYIAYHSRSPVPMFAAPRSRPTYRAAVAAQSRCLEIPGSPL